MSELSKISARTKSIALLVVFTALYVIFRFIPYSVLIGGGGSLSLSDFLAPIFGIILGPYLGGLSVILGNFAALGLGRPSIFLGLDFLPDLVAAVSVGFLVRRRWAPVVLLNATLLVVFFLNPLTSFFVTIPGTTITIPFAWMHIVAFAVLLSPLGLKASQWVTAPKQIRQIATGLAILTFIGTMMQHVTGNILYEVVYGQIGSPPIIPASSWPAEWALVVLAYPVERLVLIIAAVLVGTPLILILNKSPILRSGK
jgi:hypothetical protein